MGKEKYTDLSNVSTMRNFLIPEEMPEGPYGSPINKQEPVQNKSTPWEKGQQVTSAYTYENRTLHQDIPRKDPSSHPTHSNPDVDEEQPYDIE